MKARRPPQRRCQVCGGVTYAWQELAVCSRRECQQQIEAERETLRELTGRTQPAPKVKGPGDVIPY